MERDTNPGSGPNMNSKAVRGVMHSLYTHEETHAHTKERKKESRKCYCAQKSQ